jgi:PD-(D/E)XK nuclease superfamily
MLLKNKIKRKQTTSIIKDKPKLWDLYKDGVTKSMLEKFHSCPEKMRLSYIEGLRGDTDSAALKFGNIVHSTLEYLYANGVRDEDSVTEILDRLRQEETNQATGLDKAKKLSAIEENYDLAYPVILAYLKHWEGIDLSESIIDIEKEFCIEFNGINIRGKIDKIYRSNTNAIWFRDIKTKGQINEQILRLVMANDLQLNLYAWAAKQLYNEPIKGVQYDIIRKPQLRQRKEKNPESREDFIDRVAKDIADRPEFYFVRLEFLFSQKELQNWEKEFTQMIREIVSWNEGLVPHYKRTVNCETRYGSCEFLNYCATGNKFGYAKRDMLFPELKGVDVDD